MLVITYLPFPRLSCAYRDCCRLFPRLLASSSGLGSSNWSREKGEPGCFFSLLTSDCVSLVLSRPCCQLCPSLVTSYCWEKPNALKLLCISPPQPRALLMEPPYWATWVYTAQIQGAFHTGSPLNHRVEHFRCWDGAISTHNTTPVLMERIVQALRSVLEETEDKGTRYHFRCWDGARSTHNTMPVLMERIV